MANLKFITSVSGKNTNSKKIVESLLGQPNFALTGSRLFCPNQVKVSTDYDVIWFSDFSASETLNDITMIGFAESWGMSGDIYRHVGSQYSEQGFNAETYRLYAENGPHIDFQFRTKNSELPTLKTHQMLLQNPIADKLSRNFEYNRLMKEFGAPKFILEKLPPHNRHFSTIIGAQTWKTVPVDYTGNMAKGLLENFGAEFDGATYQIQNRFKLWDVADSVEVPCIEKFHDGNWQVIFYPIFGKKFIATAPRSIRPLI